MSKAKKNIKVRDLKPNKDAKGGGGFKPQGGGSAASGGGKAVSGGGSAVSGGGSAADSSSANN